MVWGLVAVARLMQAAMDHGRASIAAGELAVVAGAVIGHRAPLMAAAVHTPWRADYDELTRMVPEKITAFWAAGAAVVNEWLSMQRDIGGYAASLGDAVSAGWLPTAMNIIELLDRSSEHGVGVAARMLGVPSVALDPIHRSAAANAQRLALLRAVNTV